MSELCADDPMWPVVRRLVEMSRPCLRCAGPLGDAAPPYCAPCQAVLAGQPHPHRHGHQCPTCGDRYGCELAACQTTEARRCPFCTAGVVRGAPERRP